MAPRNQPKAPFPHRPKHRPPTPMDPNMKAQHTSMMGGKAKGKAKPKRKRSY